MRITHEAISFIKRWEGCRLRAYRDGGGVLTIGYGHTSAAGPPYVTAGLVIGQDRADEILANDLDQFALGVSKLVTVPLNANEAAALLSFAFNIGLGAFGKSTLLRLVNAGDRALAAEQFGKWVFDDGRVVQGLANRRQAERALFLTPAAQPPQPALPPVPPLPAGPFLAEAEPDPDRELAGDLALKWLLVLSAVALAMAAFVLFIVQPWSLS